MSISDIMDDEYQKEQVIMVKDKPVKIGVILDELLHRKDDKQRKFSEG